MDFGEKKEIPTLKLPELYEFVDKNRATMIDALKEAAAIPSLSLDDQHFTDVTKMLEFCQSKMKDLGATTEFIATKNSRTDGGVSYPSILFGNLFVDEELKTVCVYGHVDALSRNDGKISENNDFNSTVKNGRIHGCGVSRSKGPFFCWLNALKTFVSTKNSIPVNVKFIVEGTAELHSPTLDDVLQRKKDFFRDVDYVCLTVDKKINEIPCLRYGYRGVCHFSLDISCGNDDTDSGTYGGAFDQPMIDAVRVVSSLVDKYDEIAVTDVMKDVVTLTDAEKNAIDGIPTNIEDFAEKIGVERLRQVESFSEIVIRQTRLPSITVHGFESKCRTDGKNRAMVPSRTVAKFSMRLVPNQTAGKTRIHVENHVKKVWSQWKSVNDYELKMDLGINPWREDPTSPHYLAAAEAIKSVYSKEPLYVCGGCSLPAVSILKAVSPQSSALILSLSDSDDRSENDESMSAENYINGVKVVIAYMCKVHEIPV